MLENGGLIRPTPGFRRVVALVAAAALCAPAGCVQRRMTIRTNPPGALVYVDDHEIGTTPVSTDFTYYGTRKIRLVKDGYETQTFLQPVPAPWYEIPPLDFISENLLPGELRDHRTFTYQLRPQLVVPTEQLLERAEGLRAAARSPGGMMTAPVASPTAAAPNGSPGAYASPATRSPAAAPPGSGGMPVYPLSPGGQAR